MIWIRADGGKTLGLGHVMRCLSVANALHKLGEKVMFLLADDSVVPILEEKKQAYFVLQTDYQRMEEELEKLLPLLGEYRPRLMLVDSYFVTKDYVEALRQHTKVAYMDDMCSLDFPVDYLINYNIFATASLYTETVQRESKVLMIGPRYVPLRDEFLSVDYEVRPKLEKIMVTTGGSDAYNLAGQFLEEILDREEFANIQIFVVCGAYNANLPYLQLLGTKDERVHICQNVTRISELMRSCDVAVTAGGSTVYELSAVGVPLLCFSFVANQERIVEGFARENISCYAGNYLQQGRAMFTEIANELAGRLTDVNIRQKYSKCLRELVDGKGAMRIAETLLK